MICVLPSWVAHLFTVSMLLAATGTAYYAFHALSVIGARRHPRMDFDDSHRRRWWDSGGIVLGAVVFLVVGMVFGEFVRPEVCHALGSYVPRPPYSLP